MRRLLLAALLIHFSFGYVFECLDKCECDTQDEVIHCHNSGRTSLKLPSDGSRLRGFEIIGLTYNDVLRLPEEEMLLAKFPDLKAVDVERNANFDCDSLKDYSKVAIVSDCFKNVTDVMRVPPVYRPSRFCDLPCQASRHYDKLHDYVISLWKIMKEKYENFDFDETMKDVKEFFVMVNKKMNKMGSDLHSEFIKKHPKDIATPMPELQEVEID